MRERERVVVCVFNEGFGGFTRCCWRVTGTRYNMGGGGGGGSCGSTLAPLNYWVFKFGAPER